MERAVKMIEEVLMIEQGHKLIDAAKSSGKWNLK